VLQAHVEAMNKMAAELQTVKDQVSQMHTLLRHQAQQQPRQPRRSSFLEGQQVKAQAGPMTAVAGRPASRNA
jgi:hypothetical protein